MKIADFNKNSENHMQLEKMSLENEGIFRKLEIYDKTKYHNFYRYLSFKHQTTLKLIWKIEFCKTFELLRTLRNYMKFHFYTFGIMKIYYKIKNSRLNPNYKPFTQKQKDMMWE